MPLLVTRAFRSKQSRALLYSSCRFSITKALFEVNWYRPKEERDEESGQLIGMKKKFRDDYLQRSYDQMAETFGLSKKQATEAVKALESMGIIKRIFKTIQVRGQILNNVLFIKLVPKRLYEVTFPEEIEENTLSPPKEDYPYR